MAKYRDNRGTYDIERDRALAKLVSGTHTNGRHELDFGSSAIHLTKAGEFHLEGSARGFVWKAGELHHALIELRYNASEEQAADVAHRFGGELTRGFFDIPASGLRTISGPYVTLLAPPEPAAPPAPPPPSVTLLTLVRDKLVLGEAPGAPAG